MSTALVVGGTGMLAAATRWLAERHDETVLVSRHARRFAAAEPDPAAYAPLDLDWDDPTFVGSVVAALADRSPVVTCLLWSHEPDDLVARLAPVLAPARTVLVLATTQRRLRAPARAAGLTTVQLGSVVEDGERRWLTHDEITEATLAALGDGRDRVVGEQVPAEG